MITEEDQEETKINFVDKGDSIPYDVQTKEVISFQNTVLVENRLRNVQIENNNQDHFSYTYGSSNENSSSINSRNDQVPDSQDNLESQFTNTEELNKNQDSQINLNQEQQKQLNENDIVENDNDNNNNNKTNNNNINNDNDNDQKNNNKINNDNDLNITNINNNTNSNNNINNNTDVNINNNHGDEDGINQEKIKNSLKEVQKYIDRLMVNLKNKFQENDKEKIKYLILRLKSIKSFKMADESVKSKIEQLQYLENFQQFFYEIKTLDSSFLFQLLFLFESEKEEVVKLKQQYYEYSKNKNSDQAGIIKQNIEKLSQQFEIDYSTFQEKIFEIDENFRSYCSGQNSIKPKQVNLKTTNLPIQIAGQGD